MTSRISHGALGLLAIASALLAAHAGGLHGVFVFDDEIAIVQHERIGELWPPLVPLTGPHESPSAGRPLVALSLALNHAAGGLDTFGYHVFNLAVHFLVCALLYAVALELLRRTPAAAQRAPASALAIALIFAVHPIGTSVVTYVSQRAESMAALFILATLLAWIRHRAGDRRLPFGALAVACCYLATLSKEVGYAAPAIAALLDRAFFARTWREVWRENRGLYLAMLSSWIVLALTLAVGARGATVTWTYRDYDSWTYLLTSCRAILHYVALLFRPHPLVLDYGWPIARTLAEVWWQAALLVLAFGASLAALGRRPRAAFLGLSFFLILAPSSSFLPIVTEIMAEHRMYLPSAVVIAVVVLAAQALFTRPVLEHPRLARAGHWLAGGLLVALLAVLTRASRAQNRLYDDTLTMYRHNVAFTPDNYRAHYNLGYHLLRAEQYGPARAALAQALRLDPTYAPAHREMSYLACYTGDVRAALGHIERALELKPDDALNLTAKGSFLALLGQPDQGLAWIDRALARQPGFAEALKWRVNVLLLAQRGPAADRALAEYDPSLGPAQRQRELQMRYRDLIEMARQGAE